MDVIEPGVGRPGGGRLEVLGDGVRRLHQQNLQVRDHVGGAALPLRPRDEAGAAAQHFGVIDGQSAVEEVAAPFVLAERAVVAGVAQALEGFDVSGSFLILRQK